MISYHTGYELFTIRRFLHEYLPPCGHLNFDRHFFSAKAAECQLPLKGDMARQAFATDLVQAEIELEEVKEALRSWDYLA